MYKYIWHTAEHGSVPCNVQREIGEQLVIRVPDPYDKGEVELTVHSSQVHLAHPCEALRAVIAAHEAGMQELGERMRAANQKTLTVQGQAAIAAFDAIEQARQALALPTADHLPDAGKMVETAAPADEREAFEQWLNSQRDQRVTEVFHEIIARAGYSGNQHSNRKESV